MAETETTRPLHIGFRLSAEEKQRIQVAAKKAKVPVGTFCREGALEKAESKSARTLLEQRADLDKQALENFDCCGMPKGGKHRPGCPKAAVTQDPEVETLVERAQKISERGKVNVEVEAMARGAAALVNGIEAVDPWEIPPPPIPLDHPEFIDLRTRQLCEQGMTRLAAKRQARVEQDGRSPAH